MDTIENDNFSEFESLWVKKLEKKSEFENMTEEKLAQKIEDVKKNCFILELQNEVLEKYLQRHNPGAVRELEKFKTHLSKPTPLKDLIGKTYEEENNQWPCTDVETSEDLEKEVVPLIINIVNQEIAELCMNSKIRKRKHDREIDSLATECDAFQAQGDYLQNALDSINAQFSRQLRVTSKDYESKLLDLIRYWRNTIKNIKIQSRRHSLAIYNLKRECSQTSLNSTINGMPVIPADLELLELEIEKLNNELSKDRQVFLDLKFLFDNYTMKLNNEKNKLQCMKSKVTNLRNNIEKMDKRLSTLDNYSSLLSEEVKLLERKKIKLMGLCSSSSVVKIPSTKKYIAQKTKCYDTMKKLKSIQKLNEAALTSDFKKLLVLSLDS